MKKALFTTLLIVSLGIILFSIADLTKRQQRIQELVQELILNS